MDYCKICKYYHTYVCQSCSNYQRVPDHFEEIHKSQLTVSDKNFITQMFESWCEGLHCSPVSFNMLVWLTKRGWLNEEKICDDLKNEY